MVLVEADPVIAEPVERLPGFEVLGIGAHRRRGVEMPLRERIGEFRAAFLQMVEIGVIRQQVENEHLHGRALPISCSPFPAADAPHRRRPGAVSRAGGLCGR